MVISKNTEDKIIYCICPNCKLIRRRMNGKYTIIKKGRERNGIARFLCLGCGKWFNENTGESLKWQDRLNI